MSQSSQTNRPNLTLADVLREAADRALFGKGLQRHGSSDVPFEQQPIITIPLSLGDSDGKALLFQALKKIHESTRLSPDAAKNELLDAIVYIAAALICRSIAHTS